MRPPAPENPHHPVELLHRPGALLRVRPKTAGGQDRLCNMVYAEALGTGLIMDVLRPASGGNGLGVVDVVSSGWHSDRVVMNEHLGFGLADALCARGFTVFAVSPGSSALFTGADMVLHVHAALRHIKQHSAHYGVEPARLGVTGASAGGHLAALAALSPQKGRPDSRDGWRRQDASVRAAALFFPPTDLIDFGGVRFDSLRLEGVDPGALLFRGGTAGRNDGEITDRLRELSPVYRAAHFAAAHHGAAPPPFLLVHGTADPLVPVAQTHRLADALRRAGGHAEVILREGGGHPWPDNEKELAAAAEWLFARLAD